MAKPLVTSNVAFFPVWRHLLRELVHAVPSTPRGLPTREILGVTLRVNDGSRNILFHPSRDLNYKFMVAEWLWIMSGDNSVDAIAQYNSRLRDFSDDGFTLFGAYGPRFTPQVQWLLAKLKEPDTRQAVATIWKPTPPPSKDTPCTVALQFLRRGWTINLIVTMRSSDIWLGLPYDFFTFSQILNCICGVLQCHVGFVQFNLGSSHIYDSSLEMAERLLNDYYAGQTMVSPGLPGMPPGCLLDTVRTPSLALTNHYDNILWQRYARVLNGKRSESFAILTS
jgi:thymidylate synthase